MVSFSPFLLLCLCPPHTRAQEAVAPCAVNGTCESPLGSSTVGLIYGENLGRWFLLRLPLTGAPIVYKASLKCFRFRWGTRCLSLGYIPCTCFTSRSKLSPAVQLSVADAVTFLPTLLAAKRPTYTGASDRLTLAAVQACPPVAHPPSPCIEVGIVKADKHNVLFPRKNLLIS